MHGGALDKTPHWSCAVQVLCAFPADVGTGGAAQRPGRCKGTVDRGYERTGLKDALREQYSGRWFKAGWSQYNEVLVGAMHWDRRLPCARSIEAGF